MRLLTLIIIIIIILSNKCLIVVVKVLKSRKLSNLCSKIYEKYLNFRAAK